ncbi:MAG: UbiX family flavin prenyltransferase [Chitinophagales bacterium]
MLAVGITGASGSVYGCRLVERLLAAGEEVALLLSQPAGAVLRHELGWRLPADVSDGAAVREALAEAFPAAGGRLAYYTPSEWTSPLASGSAGWEGLAVVPCSMGTAARIAHGISTTLLERAADVCLKERRTLVVVPRETPLSVIHLDNLLTLARAGAVVLPAAPGFYHRPTQLGDLVDFVVDRILRAFGRSGGMVPPWGGGGELD